MNDEIEESNNVDITVDNGDNKDLKESNMIQLGQRIAKL